MDAGSHAVLFEKNADELTAPASMAKTMTAEVIFNEIKSDASGTVRRLVAADGALVKTRDPLIEVEPA